MAKSQANWEGIISKRMYEAKFPPTDCSEGGVSEFEFMLSKSGAFEYGNRTAVTVFETHEGEKFQTRHFDTRYDRTIDPSGANFDEWCREFLKNNYTKPEYVVELEID